MAKKKQKKARLSVLIFESQKEALEDIAERNDVSLARVVQGVVREFLQKDGKNQLEIFKQAMPED